MKTLTPYKVTKGNTDGCVKKGDIIWQSEDGILNLASDVTGFLTPDELTDDVMDFEAEEALEFEIIKIPGHEFIIRRNR